ncbi:cytochrome ubiquinol oxidase subunit I [Tenuifilum thalassicum]|uniref:Cytochrome ubiquinol oxidase subunit I n=1 Tax=Tenuifilum thalassicum TaxID=2590900 RepID=A0A7D4CSQ7_9BACT|nr:cytochrome ubiquinol oxidase subunit I [Tenuifilum thalassicum]QKG80965.1 cytochrome ubiquinol oxidase subunit I [Tenuifilum thalassicum]
MEHFDLSLVNWSRAQFALTAMYHWIFVPLTLGLAFIMAFMETLYYKTGDEEWKRITKFWMTLFGINFAIGVATGIILEFEFGTNWSNYSWFVGDIFGAPLAIEGIMAFFMESTFIAVMFFGWNKVSKKFHLISTWLVALGANLSALWILVANAWMQYPAGMNFNPDTARNEMQNFWEVLFSPVAVNKFLHTITSGYVLAALFVIGISAWYLLKGRNILLAKRSIIVASVFGLITSIFLALTGDGSAYQVAQKQPMKLAAMEGLYEGTEGAPLVVVGALTPGKEFNDEKDPFIFRIQIPKLLSFLGYRSGDAFVPGVKDIIEGGYTYTDKNGKQKVALSAEQKIQRGKIAIQALADYRNAKDAGDTAAMEYNRKLLDENFEYFGYGYLNDPKSIIPNVPLTFYSFHIMVALGFLFIAFFALMLYLIYFKGYNINKWLLRLGIIMVPLAYIASQAGWIVAEVGRQPWVIQDILPTVAAVSRIDASAVQVTFFLFFAIFTTLLIAELKIMFTQIKKGPKDGGK